MSDALAGRETLGDQELARAASRRPMPKRSASEAVRDLRYRNGVASALDLLDAQRSLFVAQQAAVQARLTQLQNQVALYKALGGGWKD